ncbi:hypothetical protein PsorP6_002319 [Peronosclerospora sorghi]|uniref:Uncharacterized protein n=1 Tax=Peronosclerospora sorghi TaxID=230839 RepID=A0ACC0WX41_9STRA|nr:hypothetical protein PsorP6_002319 [Peronosclerospora sorghi]
MPFAEIEVMKMYGTAYSTSRCHSSAQVRRCRSGAWRLYCYYELDNPSCVKKSDVYMGKLPSSENSNGSSTKAVHKMRDTLAVLKSVLQGYFAPEDFTQKAMVGLFSALNEPLLPVEEIEEAMSSLAGCIPLEVFARITNKIHTFKKAVTEEPTATHEFNVTEVIEIIDEHTKSLETERQRSDFEASVMSIREIATKYRDGLQSGEESVLTELLYGRVCNSTDLNKVFAIARSLQALEAKNRLLLQLLAQMKRGTPCTSKNSAALVPLLENLATFKEKEYSLVALEARQLLIDNKMPSYRDRLSQSLPLFDLLISLLDHEEQQIRELALELYVLRVYHSYVIESIETISVNDVFAKTFQFKSPVIDALAVGVAPPIAMKI